MISQTSTTASVLTKIGKEHISAQYQDSDQIASANNRAAQDDGRNPLEGAMSNDDVSKKSMKRIRPEKIAEVGEWKAYKRDDAKKSMKRIRPEKIAEVGEWKVAKEDERADKEDNAKKSMRRIHPEKIAEVGQWKAAKA